MLLSAKEKNMKLHSPIYLPYLKSLIISLIILPISLFLLALVMYALQLPKEAAPVLGAISLCAASLCGGHALGKSKRRSGIKQGCLCGGSVFLIGLILSLIFGEASFTGALIKLLLCLFFGIFGAVLGVNRKIGK